MKKLSFESITIIVTVIVFALIFGFVYVADSQRQTIELKADEWVCTKRENRPRLIPMGKGMVSGEIEMCVEYSRSQ